jgi:WD40 repeat protein
MRVTAVRVIPALLLLTVRVAAQDGGRGEPEAHKDLYGDSLPRGARVRLGCRWLFHPAPILSLAASPDGTVLAAGTEDGEFRLWEAATGKPILRRKVGVPVHSVAFSPDGQLLATAGEDGEVYIWEAEKGGFRQRLKGHGAPVYALAFAPDGNSLVSGSAREERILVWNLATSKPIATITQRALALALGSDRTLAVASGRNTVDLWDVQGRSLGHLTLRPVGPHPFAPLSLAWAGESGRLVMGCMDNTVRIWDAKSRRELHALEGHRDGVRAVAVVGDTIASGGEEGSVIFWSLVNGRPLGTARVSEVWVLGLAFIRNGNLLASAGNDGHLRFWKVPTGRPVSPVETHGGRVTGVCILDDRVVTAGKDGIVRSWEIDSGRHLRLLESSDRRLTCLAYEPRSDRLASGDGAGTVVVRELGTADLVCRIDAHDEPVSAVAFAEGGERLLTSSLDGTVRLWSLDAPERALETMRHDAAVTAMDVSPERGHVVIGCRDGTVVIRDTRGKILASLDGRDRIAGVGFLKGDRVFAAQSDGMLRVWDARTGATLSALRHPDGRVFSAACSPDGLHVATAGEHGEVVLWQPSREEPLRVVEGHEGFVSCLAFSSDGKLLASGGWDGTALVWETDATNRDRDSRK